MLCCRFYFLGQKVTFWPMMFKRHVKLSEEVAVSAKRLFCLRLRFTHPTVISQWTPLTFSDVSEVLSNGQTGPKESHGIITRGCHYHAQWSIRKWKLKSCNCSPPQRVMSLYFFFIVAIINKCVKQIEIITRHSYLAWFSYNERKLNCERSKIAAVFSINTGLMAMISHLEHICMLLFLTTGR